jgi:hypothetical protein
LSVWSIYSIGKETIRYTIYPLCLGVWFSGWVISDSADGPGRGVSVGRAYNITLPCTCTCTGLGALGVPTQLHVIDRN